MSATEATMEDPSNTTRQRLLDQLQVCTLISDRLGLTLVELTREAARLRDAVARAIAELKGGAR